MPAGSSAPHSEQCLGWFIGISAQLTLLTTLGNNQGRHSERYARWRAISRLAAPRTSHRLAAYRVAAWPSGVVPLQATAAGGYRAAVPFIALREVAALLVTYASALTHWLPALLFGD